MSIYDTLNGPQKEAVLPYIWMQCGMPSWEYFDKLLNNAQLVGTPGAGFGKNGEGFFRLTAFGGAGNTVEAAQRLLKLK